MNASNASTRNSSASDTRGKRTNPADADIGPHLGRRLVDVERDMVAGTLARCGGNRTWAADVLGLSLTALRDKLVSYGEGDADDVLAVEEQRSADERMARLQAYVPAGRPS